MLQSLYVYGFLVIASTACFPARRSTFATYRRSKYEAPVFVLTGFDVDLRFDGKDESVCVSIAGGAWALFLLPSEPPVSPLHSRSACWNSLWFARSSKSPSSKEEPVEFEFEFSIDPDGASF